MRIFSNHHTSLNFTSETVAVVERFTPQQIKILCVALAALSCLILGILIYRRHISNKIEKQPPNDLPHAIQTQNVHLKATPVEFAPSSSSKTSNSSNGAN